MIKDAVTDLCEFRVVVDSTLTDHLVEVDCENRLIKIKPGQSIDRMQTLVSKAWLWVAGGDECAPQFRRSRPQLRVIPGGRSLQSVYEYHAS